MTVTEHIKVASTAQGLRDLADMMENKYPGCTLGYVSSNMYSTDGPSISATIYLPEGTTVVLPAIAHEVKGGVIEDHAEDHLEELADPEHLDSTGE